MPKKYLVRFEQMMNYCSGPRMGKVGRPMQCDTLEEAYYIANNQFSKGLLSTPTRMVIETADRKLVEIISIKD